MSNETESAWEKDWQKAFMQAAKHEIVSDFRLMGRRPSETEIREAVSNASFGEMEPGQVPQPCIDRIKAFVAEYIPDDNAGMPNVV